MSEKLVLIDGHSILNRAFYGVPDLSNAEGLHTNAIYGFLNIMLKILEEENPGYLAVAFDVHAPTFRHELYAEYKGTRKPMPEELRQQVPVMKEVLAAMGICTVEQAGLEADDILGTLAKRGERDGMEVALVSGDRDLLQIAGEHIKIRIPKTKGGRTEIEDYYAKDVLAAWQVTPEQFVDLKALMGDSSDNIPGVPKVGPKTAQELMTRFGSLDNIYAHLDEVTKKSIKESLSANRDLAELSRTLARINTQADLSVTWDDMKLGEMFTPEAYTLFQKLEFKNMLGRFQEQPSTDEGRKENYRISGARAEAEAAFGRARQERRAAFLVLEDGNEAAGTASNRYDGSGFTALAFAAGDEEIRIFTRSEEITADYVRSSLSALAEEGVRLATFQIKFQYGYLQGMETDGLFDVLIAAYLLNPLKNDYSIADIAHEHLDLTIKEKSLLLGKSSWQEALIEKPEEFLEYAGDAVHAIWKSWPVLEEKLKQADMEKLFAEIEMPLTRVLHDMEMEGIRANPQALMDYGDALVERIGELEKSIHEKAGEAFNINSPKQLGEILFGKMKLPGGKKTKTGYSTAADVLEKLAEEHPIASEILEYRGLAKLKSTYADGLLPCIGPDGRIHTTLNQTITATGRISSTEPNLQNIPMRMELGRLIRRAFIPKEGYLFTDADYSQIELRVLAHMSGDEQLIEAYRMDADIHRITASRVFHTPFEEVTDLQRRNAKAVNFGIVYGISSFGLSQDLSISRKEASEYIEEYFKTYPGVKAFLDREVASAKEKGYSVTLFERRRPVPELKSSNFMQRSFGERVAMNAPIQGTAADIIKIAMIRVWRRLAKENLKSRLILQIHDELIFDVLEEEREIMLKIVEEGMQNVMQLKVPLIANASFGKTWYEAK